MYADTLHESNDELLRLFLLLDYSTEYLFMSFNDRNTSVIRQAIEVKNVKLALDYWNLYSFLADRNSLQVLFLLKMAP